jgi:cyclopropane fatty-acyl-phospholipid synthase-like methyltransferase
MYRHRVTRIWNELRHQQKDGADTPLAIADLLPLDQYHYLGVAPVEEAARHLKIGAGDRILDIGAGVGGTARYLADKFGCRVTGIELLEHLCTAAGELTRRTGLSDRVAIFQGDILEVEALPIAGQQFDGWVALMVFLHIPQRQQLLRHCHALLKAGGRFYIEDYYLRRQPTETERHALAATVACPYLPSREEYESHLESAGFSALEFVDVTPQWTDWVQQRATQFHAERDRHLAVHGAALVESYDHFYRTVADLFASGAVGGVRLAGQKL